MKWLVIPIIKLVEAAVHFADDLPTLQEIADEFKPNAGNSLRDTVDRIERNQTDMDERFDTLENKIDTFILQSFPGGQRATDPEV